MRTLLRCTPALLVLGAVMACSSLPGAGRSFRSPDVIRGDELRRYSELTAFELIRRVRPLWLNDRLGDQSPGRLQGLVGFSNPAGIKVYVDGVYRQEGLEELDRLWTDEIREMRKLDSSDATTRFGVGHNSGAILVEVKG